MVRHLLSRLLPLTLGAWRCRSNPDGRRAAQRARCSPGGSRRTVGVVNPVARGIVATGRYIAALPAGCAATTVGTEVLQKCGATYYRAHGTQYEVVTVQ